MKSHDELTEQELEKIEELAKKYKTSSREIETKYCFTSCFDSIERDLKLKYRYRKLGINDFAMVREIESKLAKINFYTKTIEALIKVGWSPAGVDGVITGFHNERATLINEIGDMTKHILLVKQNKNHKGPFKVYNREEYLKKNA